VSAGTGRLFDTAPDRRHYTRKGGRGDATLSQIQVASRLITLRYTAPVKCLFWKRFQMITIGERLVKLLVDLNFENHPIIVHCFSNGGAFLYQNFMLALERSPKPIQVGQLPQPKPRQAFKTPPKTKYKPLPKPGHQQNLDAQPRQNASTLF
jgi:hypothetical protein